MAAETTSGSIDPKKGPRSGETEPDSGISTAPSPSKIEQLERREGELWLVALWMLVLLALVFAITSWDKIRAMPGRLEALPIGLVVLVALFGAYVWSKTREIAELRGLVRGFEQRAATPPSEKQLEQLFGLIAQSQQGYRDLIDTFDDVLVAVSLHGEIRAANRSFAELLDRPFSDIVGHRLDEFLDALDGTGRATVQKALPRLLERRQWSGAIAVRLRKDGRIHHFDCRVYLMARGAEVTGISVLARDVTQHRINEARFTELFETLQEGVFCTTPDGKFLDANPALARMFGYESKEQLMHMNAVDLYFDPADRAAGQAEIERLGTAQTRERTLRRKDGTPLHCLISATPIRDPRGQVTRFQGTVMDITQQRKMEKTLHEKQELARRMVDSFPDPILVLDTEGHCTYVSPRVEAAMGYTPEEYIRIPVGSVTLPEDRPAVMRAYREICSGEKSFASLEYRVHRKDQEVRTVRSNAAPLLDEHGRITGVVASMRDITDLKRLEQQVIQTEKLSAMGQLIAGIAHELNNPLTAILGVSELLRDRATDDAMRRQLELSHRQARRAAHIVKSLLSFSWPHSPGKTRVQLGEVLQRTLQLQEHSLRINNVTVEFTPRFDLPAVVGDADQLVQVFLNIIANAEHAIREVRDRGRLRLGLVPAGKFVRITFEDDGPGIKPDDLPRLFDPFFTTKRPGRGTGLGLSICMAIVKEHGGDIEAKSLPGGGALFTIWLPAEPDLPKAIDQRAEESESAAAQGRGQARAATQSVLRGRSILVVDDEEGIRELVQEGLAAQGMRVDCAATGEEALRLVAERAYDSVLCDLNLSGGVTPAISGKKLFEQICRRAAAEPHWPAPAFFFMTGDLMDPAAMQEFTRAGARVVYKPFQISELAAALVEALQAPERSKA